MEEGFCVQVAVNDFDQDEQDSSSGGAPPNESGAHQMRSFLPTTSIFKMCRAPQVWAMRAQEVRLVRVDLRAAPGKQDMGAARTEEAPQVGHREQQAQVVDKEPDEATWT